VRENPGPTNDTVKNEDKNLQLSQVSGEV